MDINRPFGNGIDDSVGFPGVGTIDEPNEVAAETNTFAVEPGSGMVVPTEFQSSVTPAPDYNFDTITGVTGRELLARHLYVLMMAMTGDQTTFTDAMGMPLPAASRLPIETSCSPVKCPLPLCGWVS